LQLTAPLHDQFLGTYHLTSANTYSGGTELYGGRLIVGDLAAGFPTATLGTGNVTVFNSRAPFGIEVSPEARALLTIPTGVLDAINDTATLTIGGGFTASSAQAGAVELQADIDETVGALVLGNTTYSAIGTYGSTASGADFTFDEFFSGLGVVRIDASAGLTGDYNNDGTVDAADYVLWRKNPAAFGGPGGYATWSQNFGEGGSGSGSGAVPEPSALLLAIGAVLCLLACRRASPRTLAWELVRNRSYQRPCIGRNSN
jgi:autotransporter-associated beta strand protein